MKKIIAISTLLIYITLSVVQVISIHLCHGELESIALSEGKSECCEGMHACHTSCCEDIIIEVDFDSDHIYSEEISFIVFDRVFELFNINHNISSAADEPQAVNIPPPPRPQTQPKLYSLHASFLFYG